jgi:hypothetical protein
MAQWSSPSSTGTTNEIKVITRLGKAGEEWLTIAFTLHILVDHQPVHNFLDDKQLGKSADTASIYPAAIS